MNDLPADDLGFTYQERNDGVVVFMRGRLAATLRGFAAEDFLAEVEPLNSSAAQQLMARVTGNFKRGNERLAGLHPRNRRRD